MKTHRTASTTRKYLAPMAIVLRLTNPGVDYHCKKSGRELTGLGEPGAGLGEPGQRKGLEILRSLMVDRAGEPRKPGGRQVKSQQKGHLLQP